MGSNLNFKNMGDVPPENNGGRPSEIFPLARQTSIYSLTFDEFQNTMGGLGKDFGSMNMDEFLRNIWIAEEAQVMGMPSSSSFGATEGGLPNGNLQRQGSLTLPRTLSQKTVDEVWRDLFKESGGSGSGGGGGKEGVVNVNGGSNLQQRQQTFGEITLEEFLVRAGVVREEIQPIERPSNGFYAESYNANNDNTGLALGFGQPNRTNGISVLGAENNKLITHQNPNLGINGNGNRSSQPLHLSNNSQLANQGIRGGVIGQGKSMMNNGFVQGGGGVGMVGLGTGPVTISTISPAGTPSSDGLGPLGKTNCDSSSLSPVPYAFNGSLRGKRTSAVVEKVVERRQKRMIKNRESAARSRARKQAYTLELESEVAKLKEENQDLQKKQAEIVEMHKKQVLEIMNQQPGAKRQCLRRTQTGPW